MELEWVAYEVIGNEVGTGERVLDVLWAIPEIDKVRLDEGSWNEEIATPVGLVWEWEVEGDGERAVWELGCEIARLLTRSDLEFGTIFITSNEDHVMEVVVDDHGNFVDGQQRLLQEVMEYVKIPDVSGSLSEDGKSVVWSDGNGFTLQEPI